MSLRADNRYHGTVTRGGLVESSKGTPGFEFLIECEEGSIVHTIWISSKNEEYAKKDLETIGADLAKLGSPSYLENQLPLDVQGTEVVFGTKEEEYKGKTSIRVAWIGKPKAPASDSLFGSVASIFGGGKAAPSSEVSDEDIPF